MHVAPCFTFSCDPNIDVKSLPKSTPPLATLDVIFNSEGCSVIACRIQGLETLFSKSKRWVQLHPVSTCIVHPSSINKGELFGTTDIANATVMLSGKRS